MVHFPGSHQYNTVMYIASKHYIASVFSSWWYRQHSHLSPLHTSISHLKWNEINKYFRFYFYLFCKTYSHIFSHLSVYDCCPFRLIAILDDSSSSSSSRVARNVEEDSTICWRGWMNFAICYMKIWISFFKVFSSLNAPRMRLK